MEPSVLAITFISTAAKSALSLKLLHFRKTYPWFIAYLLASALQSFIILLDYRTKLYASVWLATTPFIVLLRVAIVAEAWKNVMGHQRNIGRIAYQIALGALAVATIAAAATGLDLLSMGKPENLFWIYSLAIRYSATILAGSCALLWLFAKTYWHRLPKNAIRHSGLLALYLGTIGGAHLLIHLFRGHASIVPPFMVGSSAACYVLWMVVMTGSGEVAPSVKPIAQPDVEVILRRWNSATYAIRQIKPFRRADRFHV